MSTALKYRLEIDGLRAIAVLSVILFHAGIPGFSGGFVGVDVFFVISGYLITGILLQELKSENFSIVSFYERRMRRILPALFFVLAACMAFGWFILSPYAFGQLGQGMMAVVVFMSNILFRHTINYFTATMENPLLHTWSLGVEEQFYIFFPIFIFFIWRYARSRMWFWMIFSMMCSLGISQWAVSTGHLLAAFYLSPARAFELLLGSLVTLAKFEQRIPRLPASIETGFGWCGFGLILWGIAEFDQATPFPGWHALFPTMGTVMILAFTRAQTWPGRLLSSRVMVGIGLTSYSAYLWHQPLFSFAHIYGWQLDLADNLWLVMASLLLAWLSWRYVERPFRDPLKVSRQAIFRWAAAGSLLFFGCGLWLYSTQGVPARFSPEEMRWWKYVDIDQQSKYVIKQFGDLRGEFANGEKRKVLILGDSYAQDFANMVHETGRWKDYQIRTVYIPAICQISKVDEDVSQYILPADRPTCAHQENLQSSASLIRQADVVVLAAQWAEWAAQRLPATIANLHLRSDQRLIVIGTKEFGHINIRQMLALGEAGRAALRHSISVKALEVNSLMKRSLPSDVFVDQLHIVCGPAGRCPIVTDQDNLISYDGGHLTQEGAAYIGQLIFAAPVLAQIQ